MHQDNSHTHQHDSTAQNLTGLAIGRGEFPDAGVGRSSPLPYPPSEKGAASADWISTANPSIQRTQHKSPSAASVAMGQNTSWPPDNNVLQPHANASNDGAWFSTIGAQRGASMTSSGKPEVLSHDQQYGGMPPVFTEMFRIQQDRPGTALLLSGTHEVPPRDQRVASMTSPRKPEVLPMDQLCAMREAMMAKAMAAMAQLEEQAVSLLEVQEVQVHGRHAYGQVDASVSQREGAGRSQRESMGVMSPQTSRGRGTALAGRHELQRSPVVDMNATHVKTCHVGEVGAVSEDADFSDDEPEIPRGNGDESQVDDLSFMDRVDSFTGTNKNAVAMCNQSPVIAEVDRRLESFAEVMQDTVH